MRIKKYYDYWWVIDLNQLIKMQSLDQLNSVPGR